MADRDYADGGVLQLSGGRSELDAVLAAASRRGQAVLVQFSAQWCGPCRMMVPVVADVARRHASRLAAVKTDIEATPANQALAAELRVQSLPTFQVYVSGRLVDSLRGADRAGLERLVQSALTTAGPPRRPGDMARRLAVQLARVKTAAPAPEFMEAVRTLLRFVGNVLGQPTEPKFRRVKAANAAFSAKACLLGRWPGGIEAMEAIGFNRREEAAEVVLVMDDVPEELGTVRDLLEAAMRGSGQTAGAGTAAGGAAADDAAPSPAALTSDQSRVAALMARALADMFQAGGPENRP